MQDLYKIALTSHITGLSILAGVTLVDFVIMRTVCKKSLFDKKDAATIFDVRSKFPVVFSFAIILIIFSGVTMMGITHGAFGEQTWIKIKFTLVAFIIINGLAVGRRQSSRMMKLLLPEGNSYNERDIAKVKLNINWFYLSQLTCLAIIFTLSVFKFN